MKAYRYVIGVFVCAAVAVAAPQEAPVPAAGHAVGEVLANDASQQRITLRTDQGETLAVKLDPKTAYLRVPPGEKDLKNAARIQLADIGMGDRVLARGRLSDDRKSLFAASVMVMTRADLAQKHQRDREEWQRRGLAGTVTDVDPAKGEITISTTAREGPKTTVIEISRATGFLRYAPDSVRFSDAKPGTLADLKAGDHLRALGDPSADGARLKAEQLVSGAFRNVAGTVKTVSAAAGELVITDLATRKPLTVKVDADSTLRRLPPMVAAMLARRFNPGARGELPQGDAAAQPAHSLGNGPRQGGGPGGGGDLQRLLERMPTLGVAELKPGDAIIVSSTQGVDPARITAITLVAGVEPLLTAAPQGGRQLGGTWNFGDIGMPQ